MWINEIILKSILLRKNGSGDIKKKKKKKNWVSLCISPRPSNWNTPSETKETRRALHRFAARRIMQVCKETRAWNQRPRT